MKAEARVTLDPALIGLRVLGRPLSEHEVDVWRQWLVRFMKQAGWREEVGREG